MPPSHSFGNEKAGAFSWNRTIHLCGINALHKLSLLFSNAECLVIKLNAVPRILEVMARFSADDEVVKWACMLASYSTTFLALTI